MTMRHNDKERLARAGRSKGRSGQRRASAFPLALLLAGTLAAAATWTVALWRAPHAATARRAVYTREGGGGFLPAPAVHRPQVALSPLQRLDADYAAGRYAAVDQEAQALLAHQGDAEAGQRRQAARAALLWAYTAAWKHDFATAGERFTLARNIAGSLPDHGAAPFHYGDPEPSIEEEAAFQETVCAGAGRKAIEAEAGYRRFMQLYPQSLLIHAAVKRIAHYHGGDVPRDAEALWRHAMNLQREQQRQEQREQSLCGPECLAELLRRRGTVADVHRLATEMHASERGTSLADLATVAARHGFHAQGLQLTQAGLAQQALPAIALLQPGHYVLIDHLDASGITLWNPDARGTGRGDAQHLSLPQWRQQWHGIALAITPPPAPPRKRRGE